MYQERGLQSVVGIVLAISLLWTIAIQFTDNDNESISVRSNGAVASSMTLGLVVNGTHYVILDANEDLNNGQVHNLIGSRKLMAVSDTKLMSGLQSQTSLRTADNSSTNSKTSKEKAYLFPRYFWFGAFIVYHARRFIKKRREDFEVNYEDDFFMESGLNANLQYGSLEYEDDFLSVDGSHYGAHWNGNEFDKFDTRSHNSEDLLNV
mmetsp:Transcript_234/g.552  ORF Transcript_234/g.552 Transcript_234/m.552 type:complete len:207 (+) Transcript_234:59-679(+)